MTDLTDDDREALELSDAHRYGHTARYAELTAKQLKRWKVRAEKAERKLEVVDKVLRRRFALLKEWSDNHAARIGAQMLTDAIREAMGAE